MNNNETTQDDDPFRVRSQREIVSLLTSMMKRKQLLSLHIKGGDETVITSILEIGQDSLIIDAALNATLNESIVQSDHISFEALYNNIRVTFIVDRAQRCLFREQAALKIAIPDSLIRLQRREYFRIATPIVRPLHCTFRLHRPDGALTTVITLLNNISLGGVGLTDPKQLLPITLGNIYEDCALEMSENTVVSVKLQVRDYQEVKLASGKIINRFGCEFIDTPRDVLAAIQRFITRLEREQNAKASGML